MKMKTTFTQTETDRMDNWIWLRRITWRLTDIPNLERENPIMSKDIHTMSFDKTNKQATRVSSDDQKVFKSSNTPGFLKNKPRSANKKANKETDCKCKSGQAVRKSKQTVTMSAKDQWKAKELLDRVSELSGLSNDKVCLSDHIPDKSVTRQNKSNNTSKNTVNQKTNKNVLCSNMSYSG
jgi:hypothetical protein